MESEKISILEGMDAYLPDVDGVVNCLHNYCLNLKDKATINLMVPKNKKSYIDDFPYTIHRCKSIKIPIINDYYGFPGCDKKFKREIENLDIDIIHIHSPFNMSKYALKLAKKRKVPIVATFHSNMRPIFRSVVKSKLITELMVHSIGRRYNKFDEIFVCSPLVAEQARSFGYKGKISYLPFGTDLPKCNNKDELANLANEKFNINSDELVFLYVGRIMKLKRIDFILKSLKLVKDKGIKFKFFVVGKGSELKKLQKLAKKLQFTENEVIFTGFLERELFPLINARANLLLFPSIYDNFGLVKVEAAAFETPGIFIENSCAGYGVVDGKNGYLSQNTTEAFANKICEACGDLSKLREVGKNAGNNLYISWEECSKQLLEKLKEIVNEKKSQIKE